MRFSLHKVSLVAQICAVVVSTTLKSDMKRLSVMFVFVVVLETI
jgi:hypothetical protein